MDGDVFGGLAPETHNDCDDAAIDMVTSRRIARSRVGELFILRLADDVSRWHVMSGVR
jgi:hypothetical protein